MQLNLITKDEVAEAVIQGLTSYYSQKKPDTKNHEDDTLLKVPDLCKLLDVSKTTVANWKKQGLIPYYQISDKIYFRKDEVLASLQSKQNRRRLA